MSPERTRLGRRAFGFGSAALFLAACGRFDELTINTGTVVVEEEPPFTPKRTGWFTETFEPTPGQGLGQRAEIFVPEASSIAKAGFEGDGQGSNVPPVLVMLHGWAETEKGLEAGAHAWRDYGIEPTYKRMSAPPITSEDVTDYLSAERLGEINKGLQEHPFGGLSLVCPFSPGVAAPDTDLAKDYGDFLVDALFPRVSEAMASALSRDRTGISGVSMGGRMALAVGLRRPNDFGVVSCLQPMLKPEDAKAFADLAAAGAKEKPQMIRLITAEKDPSLEGVKALSEELDQRGIKHQLIITSGGHTVDWNRSAGACEMLYFHDRASRWKID